MQIFNVGIGELLFILVIAFIVLGPIKAVKIAGEAGGWIRNLVNSNFWQEIISTSREIQDLPKRLMEEASNSFAKGFIEFQKENNWTFDKVLIEAEKYKKFVLDFSTHPNIQDIMQNQITILSVKVHSEWLENFNNKFLEKYEPRHSYAS